MFYRLDKLNGLPIEATDGEVAKVNDIYFDDHRWAARYLMVETGKVGKVDVTRDTVQGSSEYHPSTEFSRAHETHLYRHYHREGYWQ